MRQNIAERYAQIETQLVEKFCEALNTSDGKRMKIYANTLQNFHKGSEKCVMNYISHHIAGLSQSGGHLTEEVFRNMETRSAKVYKQTAEVFDDPEDIMIKYIHQATEKYLFDHVNKELTEASNQDVEKYLCKLYQLHIRAMLLRESLSKLSSQFDPVFLTKSIRATLFSEHLSGYAESEVKHLETKCKNKVVDFNNKVGIQRKANSVIRVSNALVDMETQSRPEESFISEDVCTMVLTESKSAMKRCQELLADRELSHASRDIFFTVLNVLCGDHFTVALDLAIDVKSGPVGLLFHVIGCINKNIHLVEKQYRELILPSIHYAPVAAACNEKKREYMSKLETRIEAAIEKSVGNIISTLSSLLSSQKKTDYKPEEPGIPETTPTCRKVIGHIGECAKVLKMSFDGKNLDVILLEFGVRIHRVLYEHILTFTVNSIGAMFLICDMNEYRKSIKEFGVKYIFDSNEIFDNLQTLCNLFIVMPENLKQVCTEEPYISFDRNVIMRMIQLRYDYRSAKIGKIFS